MVRTTFVTPEPVVLEGFQAILKKTQYGYTLSAVIDDYLIRQLEVDREDGLKWALSKVNNPKRSVCKPEPWEEVSNGKYKVKFSWDEKAKPPIVDTEGTPIIDERTPIYSGSKVKLAFFQKPYVLKDKETYGTTLKLVGVQVVSVNSEAGIDAGDLATEDLTEMFGTTEGYKVSEPNPKANLTEEEIDKNLLDF